MRVIFMGTSEFAVPALRSLAATDARIIAVYTRAPQPAGRGKKLRRSPVHELASEMGLAVETPSSLRPEEVRSRFAGHGADIAIVASYGLLLPRPILDAPVHGCVNIHASLLPRWRGAAPIQRAILAGDRETGVHLFQMEEGLDTGPVYLERRTDIRDDDTGGSLHDRLAVLGASMVPELLDGLRNGTLVATPQPEEGAVYAEKIRKEEAILDLRRPAREIERKIRAVDPWPGAWCRRGEHRLRLREVELVERSETDGASPGTVIEMPLTIACGEGALRVTLVQREGRKSMSSEELQRGFPIPLGTRLV